MLKKALLGAIPVVVVLALVAAIVVPPRLVHGSTIATKAIGVWRETDSPQAYKLVIRRDPGAATGVVYTVTYPRSFKVPFPASLSGDEILIWGEGEGDEVWAASYDEKTDTLTLTRPNGSETHTLKRVDVSDPAAPKWLLKRAGGTTAEGKSTQAWWTKTTLEEAARAVEPGHWQKLNEKNSRPTYLLIMRGAFTPRSYLAGPPEPVPWGFEIIDPTTRLVDGSGGRGSPFDTGGLEMHRIDLGKLTEE